MSMARPVGDLLREWRQRRRLSQLDFACLADISTRHLSFLETGRSQPSREMLLHLAERLDVPLRERNTLMIAAGYAPVFPERALGDPALEAARRAIDVVLAGHEPYPALAVDRHWTLVASNTAMLPLMEGVQPSLLQPPVNVLRVSLHPEGVARRIVNLAEWRTHVFERLRRQIDLTADPSLVDLLSELHGYPSPTDVQPASPASGDFGGVVVPLQIRMDGRILSFFTTTTVFGTPVDITLSELAIESFFPADPATSDLLRAAAATRGSAPTRAAEEAVSINAVSSGTTKM
jgi:transcriptional regulator with XRE-family HTH domain